MPINNSLFIMFILISSASYWGCQPSASSSEGKENIAGMEMAFEEAEFAYDISTPEEKFELPSELREVSGLSFADDGRLTMVQDEKGTLFFMNVEEGTVLEEYVEFEEKGDFEGVEIVGDTAYALTSDGEIFKIYPFDSDEPKVEKYKTDLSSRNDPEGLGYLKESHQLLIACKAVPNISGKNQKNHRSIYTFDLKPGTYTTKLHLRIPIKNIHTILDDNSFNRLSKDIAQNFSKGGDLRFQPSAIAVHPITSDLYILASVGKLLVVLNQEGVMVNMIKLENSIFKQPEGICFSPNGDLFISNEGKKGRANVLKFNYLVPAESE